MVLWRSRDHQDNSSDLDHNIRINIWHGALQNLANSVFTPFLGIFAIKLGATNTQIALLSSLPALMSVAAMIPGASFIRRFNTKKKITAAFFLANRLFIIAIACVPLFTGDSRAAALVALVGLMNLPGAIANVSWQSLMGDIIPSQERGSVFARRNKWSGLVGFLPTLLAGKMLDLLSFPSGYQLMFMVAFCVSLIEIAVFTMIKEGDAKDGIAQKASCSSPVPASVPLTEPELALESASASATASMPVPAPSPISTSASRQRKPILENIKTEIRVVLAHKQYFRYNLCSVLFHFGWQMGWPLFTIYQVKHLGADNFWMALFAVTQGIASFLSYQWWGHYADRVGNIRGLVLATAGMAINPIFYALSNQLWMIALFSMSMGFFVAGTVLILFNSLLEVSPKEHRTKFIAYNNTLINLSAAIAPFIGNIAADILGIKGALLATAAVRAAGAFAFAWFCGLVGPNRKNNSLRKNKPQEP